MRLAGERGEHGWLRAVEHRDLLPAAEFDHRRGYGIDADRREDAPEHGNPEEDRRGQPVADGTRLPPGPEQVGGGQEQPVPAAQAEPEGEGGEAAAEPEGEQRAEPEGPAGGDLRQGNGDEDGERHQRADQVAVEALDQREGQEADQEPDQCDAGRAVFAALLPGGEGENEDPGQGDVEQAEQDAGREIEEFAGFQFVVEHLVGRFRVEGADDEEPGQGEGRPEQGVAEQGRPVAAQHGRAQPPAGEQRQAAGAADEGDDRPLGQEAGGEQQGACRQPARPPVVEPD